MYQLRIVVPTDRSDKALALLSRTPSVCNIIRIPGAAQKPDGDVLLADVTREDTSLILSDLRDLGIEEDGSIAIHELDSSISRMASAAASSARGSSADAVVWEEVEVQTSESAELSASFLAFMILATLITSIGVLRDSSILVVGGMVVGPEFGPIAGISVALVQRRKQLAVRSLIALTVGFSLAIAFAFLFAFILDRTGLTPRDFSFAHSELAHELSHPDTFSYFIAASAGIIGVLSLTTAKSSPLVGVLISVATLPAAATGAIALGRGDWTAVGGSFEQFVINLSLMLICGTATLYIMRRGYHRRHLLHLSDLARSAAGLPPARDRPTRRKRKTK